MIRYKKDTDNIVTLTLDMTDRAVNIINYEIGRTFVPVIKHLQEEKAKGALRGVIITSAKKTFLAGGDIDFLYHSTDVKAVFEYAQGLTKFMRDLEHPGVPVVAALNGSALGSGFELAMACHHRIVINNPKIELGYPEVSLGLMPGSGGVIRLMWLLGIEKAWPILSSGHRYSPTEAQKAGIIDALAVDHDDMMDQAREWLLNTREGRRPWDIPNRTIPNGTATDLNIAAMIRSMAAELTKRTYNNFLAPQAILNTLAEGSKVDFDTACRIECRYFTQLMKSNQSKNMIKAFWFDLNSIKSGVNRPKGFGKFRPRKVGIVGAGLMGSAIAYTCANNGLKVLIKDVSKQVADFGLQYSVAKFSNQVENNIITEYDKLQFLQNIQITDTTKDFTECDLVIEAVFESSDVKAKTIKEAESSLDEYSIFASNTSSIPITQLAKASVRPANFVGIHFFPPADEVTLVEIIKGEKTSDETIARAVDFAKAIKKIPIVVKDNPGFYVARTQNTFILEAVTMLQEGYAPSLIENLCVQAGMPKGGLALVDEFSTTLILEFERQAAAHYGERYQQHPAVRILQNMQNEVGRSGQKALKGFYEYDSKGNKTELWKGISEHYPTTQPDFNKAEMIERLLFAQIIEAVWCLQEGIIQTESEANLGSVFGWGFPSFHGGVLQYINAYGLELFIEKCTYYEQLHGPRFKVPRYLKKKLVG